MPTAPPTTALARSPPGARSKWTKPAGSRTISSARPACAIETAKRQELLGRGCRRRPGAGAGRLPLHSGGRLQGVSRLPSRLQPETTVQPLQLSRGITRWSSRVDARGDGGGPAAAPVGPPGQEQAHRFVVTAPVRPPAHGGLVLRLLARRLILLHPGRVGHLAARLSAPVSTCPATSSTSCFWADVEIPARARGGATSSSASIGQSDDTLRRVVGRGPAGWLGRSLVTHGRC